MRLATLITLASLSLTSCSSPPLLDPSRYRQVSHISENPDDEMHIWTQASEEEGILQLRALVENSPREEAYVFFPEKKLWVEVGEGFKKEEDSSEFEGFTLEIKNAPLIRYLRMHPEINRVHFYHYHPNSHINVLIKHIQERKMIVDGRELQDVDISKFYQIVGNFGSYFDLKTAMLGSMRLKEEFPRIDVEEKIVAPMGICSIKLCKKGREKLAQISNCEREEYAATHSKKIDRTLWQTAATVVVREKELSMQTIAHILSHNMVEGEQNTVVPQEYLEIKFSPYSNYRNLNPHNLQK